MKKHWINLTASLLAVLLLAGCMPSNMGQSDPADETTAPAVTDPADETTAPPTDFGEETLPPEKDPGDSLIATAPGGTAEAFALEALQLRLHGKKDDWGSYFPAENGHALFVSDAVELADKLAQCAISSEEVDLTAFDEEFFLNNRLVVIPMRSNSGSVRYDAMGALTGTSLEILLEGNIDGEGTSDIADWLVFVTVPREAAPDVLTVTVPGRAGMFEPSNLTDR